MFLNIHLVLLILITVFYIIIVLFGALRFEDSDIDQNIQNFIKHFYFRSTISSTERWLESWFVRAGKLNCIFSYNTE